MSSIARPSTWRPISSRYSSVPFTMSLPICAKGPVSGARNPILIGPDCAGRGGGPSSGASRTVSTTTARARARRASMRPLLARLALSRPERAQHAARREQDDADVHGAEDQEPALGVHADEVLQEDDDGRAERGAGQRARTAERHHEQGLDRGDELHVDGAHEAVVVRPEDAREAGE